MTAEKNKYQSLKQIFGIAQFKEGQEQVISALLSGQSALAVFPTGGGKSLCYQLPAIELTGITLVISPLISLMNDQVEMLQKRGVAARKLDSTLSLQEQENLYVDLKEQKVKILYLAPERLSNQQFLKLMPKIKIALVAIDEAHCISEWGHQFRPDYMKIAQFCSLNSIFCVLLLTATAPPQVVSDLCDQFHILPQHVTRLSGYRPNLKLLTQNVTLETRWEHLVERLKKTSGSTIVYVTKQETAEEVASRLNQNQFAAQAYHAGLKAEFRQAAQMKWMTGEVSIMVATMAFGMGIDKPDVRLVIHYNAPKSIENYTQEIGRAGRDGQSSICEWLACADDFKVLENYIDAELPRKTGFLNALEHLMKQGKHVELSLYQLALACDLPSVTLESIIAYLEQDAWLEYKGSYYDHCEVVLLRSFAQIIKEMSQEEGELFQAIYKESDFKRKKHIVSVTDLAEKGLGTRFDLQAFLNELAAANDISIQWKNRKLLYELLKQPESFHEFANQLYARFVQQQDEQMKRLQGVMHLTHNKQCIHQQIGSYFGETIMEPCGQCSICTGNPPQALNRTKSPKLNEEQWQIIYHLKQESIPALSSPEQLCRFLCGMIGPAIFHQRLYKHPAYGLCKSHSFQELLRELSC